MNAYFLDILALVTIILGFFSAIIFQEVFIHLAPYTIVVVALAQFISFMPVKVLSLFKMSLNDMGEVMLWSFLKIIALPLLLWPLAYLFDPNLVAGIILTGGAATAVMAPMIASLLQGNTVRIMQVVIVSSIAMPFSLPLFMELCVGARIEFDMLRMGVVLGLAVAVPTLLAVVVRRVFPALTIYTLKAGPVLGRCLFFFTASGLVAPYALIFKQETAHCLYLMAASAGAVLFSALVGYLVARILGLPFVTGVLSLCFVNFGLTAVIASYFLGPDATILGIGFMLPSMLPVPFLRLWAERKAIKNIIEK